MPKDIIILGIETSCDETSVSIIKEFKDGNIKILSNVISSQVNVHKEFGGVVPEIASRAHLQILQSIIPKSLKQAQIKIKDIDLFELMIINKSWWDTIDFIAPKILGEYFKLYPKQTSTKIQEWISSNNIWLQRSCLLFQLKYKTNIDTKLLSHIIYSLSDSKEFFINKAIGWILREYGKVNERWVIDFLQKTKLNNLSKQQALKLINR